MSHVFDGQPDARQAGAIRPSRFRPRYRQLTPAEIELHDAIKLKAAELEALFAEVAATRQPAPLPELRLEPGQSAAVAELAAGRADPALTYLAAGMEALELAVMWSVKGLTAAAPE